MDLKELIRLAEDSDNEDKQQLIFLFALVDQGYDRTIYEQPFPTDTATSSVCSIYRTHDRGIFTAQMCRIDV